MDILETDYVKFSGSFVVLLQHFHSSLVHVFLLHEGTMMEALFVVKSKNPKTYVMEGFPWYRSGQQTTCTLFGMHVFFSVRKGTDARLGSQPKMADSLKYHTSCKTHVSCHHPVNGGKNKYIFSNQSKLNIRLKVVVGALKSSP